MALSFKHKFGYGIGHVLNDLCSAMWFSYLLLFFHHVLRFPNYSAGIILLIGQVADALSTPFVGLQADRTDDLNICIYYGRRKTWHLLGTVCVMISFVFIFMGCLVCTQGTSSFAELFYFAPFVIVFQFGWACTQISHLAILPTMTPDLNERTELNAIRYAFTVISTITVYCITWLVLGLTSNSSGILGPKDASKFIIIVVLVLVIGSLFALIFHITVKEDNYSGRSLSEVGYESTKPLMTWKDWLKESQFYQVATLYMATRLFCNLTQVYIPIYLQDTLSLDEQSIAYIPLVMYVSGLVTATSMKPVNRLVGRKITYFIGTLFGGSGILWIFFGNGRIFVTRSLYGVAILLGSGASTMLVTILSLTSDMIGSNVECSAFVYGSLSFTDKLSNGVAVMIIQYITPCPSCCPSCKEYFQSVMSYACGGAIILSLVTLLTLIPTRIGLKSFNSVLHESVSTDTRRSAPSDIAVADDDIETDQDNLSLSSASTEYKKL